MVTSPPLSVSQGLLKTAFLSLETWLTHNAPLVPKMQLVAASVSCYIIYLGLVPAAVHMKPAVKN